MNQILDRLGKELRRYFAPALLRPMNWHMIDALVKMEEIEEAKQELSEAAASPSAPPAEDTEAPKAWKD